MSQETVKVPGYVGDFHLMPDAGPPKQEAPKLIRVSFRWQVDLPERFAKAWIDHWKAEGKDSLSDALILNGVKNAVVEVRMTENVYTRDCSENVILRLDPRDYRDLAEVES